MASSNVQEGEPRALQQQQSTLLPLLLMLTLYFGIGFITAMNDVLIPHFKDLFHLTNFRALLVQFAFFGAYFLLAIPSGKVIGRIGYKAGIVCSLAVMSLGLFIFIPASFLLAYPLFLTALFIVGCGLALLQVAINPYLGALGDPARAASRLNLAGGFNSVAGTIAPRVGAAFIFVAAGATTTELAKSVRVPYFILGVLALLLSVLTIFVPLPTVLAESAGRVDAAKSAWSFRSLRFGAIAIFTYVGAEVAIGSLLINYLGQPLMGGLSHVEAARYVSLYWGGAMIARFIGFFALRHVRQSAALAFVAALAVCSVAFATFGHGTPALWALVSCGLFNSVMWPCIFPMAVAGLGTATSQGSGILVTMVVGGAVIPEIQALLADRFGYQPSFLVLLVCYGYILFFALNEHRPGKAEADRLEPMVLP